MKKRFFEILVIISLVVSLLTVINPEPPEKTSILGGIFFIGMGLYLILSYLLGSNHYFNIVLEDGENYISRVIFVTLGCFHLYFGVLKMGSCY